ncbi:MAG: glutamate 5-kinase [Bacteroidaceae bacterium]|nr:glutamate 5-kinase [Bacteroidaceae bacterium]
MKKRIVVKVGSNVLTTERGKLDITRVSALVDQIAWLRERDYEVVLVTSGAVACGRGELHVDHSLDSVEQRQLFSAMGQVKLVNLYYDLFREYNIHVGQVLTTKENFQSERSYQNQRACMEVMLENGVLPIVNENDTVSIEELMFTDNDELSGLIAKMVGAEMLILLTGVDGLYNGNPSEAGSEVIRRVRLGDDVSRYILPAKSKAGRGGMTSKFNTALSVAQSGIHVIIANGNRDGILPALIENPAQTIHTEFIPS